MLMYVTFHLREKMLFSLTFRMSHSHVLGVSEAENGPHKRNDSESQNPLVLIPLSRQKAQDFMTAARLNVSSFFLQINHISRMIHFSKRRRYHVVSKRRGERL